MAAKSHANEEGILDCLFTREEVAGAMRKLRLRKAAGPDGVIGEHLKWGGNMVQEWLLRVTNAVVDLEVVPSVLKSGILVPVYKGGGKDPMDVNSYRQRGGTDISSGESAGVPDLEEATGCTSRSWCTTHQSCSQLVSEWNGVSGRDQCCHPCCSWW